MSLKMKCSDKINSACMKTGNVDLYINYYYSLKRKVSFGITALENELTDRYYGTVTRRDPKAMHANMTHTTDYSSSR